MMRILLMPLLCHVVVGYLSVCRTCELNVRVDKDHKLLVCLVHQNAYGSFTNLFQYSGFGHKKLQEANERFSVAYERVLEDSSWEKVVFYREPLVRFVSGYLQRCNPKHGGEYGPCASAFGRNNVTFHEAVMKLQDWTKGHEKMDAHFRPQTDFCGGIGHGLAKHYRMEPLEPPTSRKRILNMLERVGIEPDMAGIDKAFPHDGKIDATHLTHAFERAEEFFDRAKYVGIAVNFFFKDYVTFRIPLPEWAKKHLEHLAKSESKYALEPAKLAVLLAISNKHEAEEL